MSPALSIIIVNWNSLDYLRACLRSIFATVQNLSFEVMVVDNASAFDPTCSLQEEFSDVTVLRSHTNLGFSAANNLGFSHSSGRYILFLNPDTELLDNAAAAMLECFRHSPQTGILGCKLLNSDRSVQTSCIQRFPTILNQILDFDLLRSRWPMWRLWGIAPLFSHHEHPVPVEVVSGACLMVPRELFQRIGGFNEAFFMYAEDVDLCYRVHRLGRSISFTDKATVLHHGGGPSRSRNGSAWIAVMQRRAILQFCRQEHGPAYAMAYRATTAVVAVARFTCLAGLRLACSFSSRRNSLHQSAMKWLSVLKWALGLENAHPAKS